jgi:hypothetical protein
MLLPSELSPLPSPREGYSNPTISGENLIGLSRARRPHNAIFVNFEDAEVPVQPLEAAVHTWKKACTNPIDQKVEEELRKVRLVSRLALLGCFAYTLCLPSCFVCLAVRLAVLTFLKLVH